MQHLSSYTENVSDEAKTKYGEKIALINGQDSFVGHAEGPSDTVPLVEASDFGVLLGAAD